MTATIKGAGFESNSFQVPSCITVMIQTWTSVTSFTGNLYKVQTWSPWRQGLQLRLSRQSITMYKVSDVISWLSLTNDNWSILPGPLDFERNRVPCICVMCHENITNGFQNIKWTRVYDWNHCLQCSKGLNSKSRKTSNTSCILLIW